MTHMPTTPISIRIMRDTIYREANMNLIIIKASV